MAADFGLLVARFNTATPAYTDDNDLRELRIDAGGRIYTRLADDRDVTIRYFYDGESVDGDPTLDRGILMLGKNADDSDYQALRLRDDGSLVVSFGGGVDISKAADSDGASGGPFGDTDTVGEISLTVGTWVKIQEIAIGAGSTLHLNGWSYGSDKNTIFQIVMSDDTGVDGHTRADATELLDTMVTTSSRPSDHVTYQRTLDREGGANIAIAIYAKQLQAGAAGIAWSMINANTTT